jgi:hypothetical protein
MHAAARSPISLSLLLIQAQRTRYILYYQYPLRLLSLLLIRELHTRYTLVTDWYVGIFLCSCISTVILADISSEESNISG